MTALDQTPSKDAGSNESTRTSPDEYERLRNSRHLLSRASGTGLLAEWRRLIAEPDEESQRSVLWVLRCLLLLETARVVECDKPVEWLLEHAFDPHSSTCILNRQTGYPGFGTASSDSGHRRVVSWMVDWLHGVGDVRARQADVVQVFGVFVVLAFELSEARHRLGRLRDKAMLERVAERFQHKGTIAGCQLLFREILELPASRVSSMFSRYRRDTSPDIRGQAPEPWRLVFLQQVALGSARRKDDLMRSTTSFEDVRKAPSFSIIPDNLDRDHINKLLSPIESFQKTHGLDVVENALLLLDHLEQATTAFIEHALEREFGQRFLLRPWFETAPTSPWSSAPDGVSLQKVDAPWLHWKHLSELAARLSLLPWAFVLVPCLGDFNGIEDSYEAGRAPIRVCLRRGKGSLAAERSLFSFCQDACQASKELSAEVVRAAFRVACTLWLEKFSNVDVDRVAQESFELVWGALADANPERATHEILKACGYSKEDLASLDDWLRRRRSRARAKHARPSAAQSVELRDLPDGLLGRAAGGVRPRARHRVKGEDDEPQVA